MSAASPASATSAQAAAAGAGAGAAAPHAAKLRLPASCDPPGDADPPKPAVWLIFGATGHMGRSLVRAALAHGEQVVAVGRTFENTEAQMAGWHERCLGLLCDVRIRETVEAVVRRSVEHWGRVDVIANCTGYGVVAAAEEQSEHDVYNQYSTNFLGTLHIIQASLPYFRTNKVPGRYLIFSSTAGALGVPGLAPFAASKYAVEGLVESMLYETDCYGIKATLVEPGYVRQDDSTAALSPEILSSPPPAAPPASQPQTGRRAGRPRRPDATQLSPPTTQAEQLKRYGHFVIKPPPRLDNNSPYDYPTSPAGHAKRVFQWLDSRQPTSAVRSAELVWQLGRCAHPPLRLLLGAYAVDSIRDRLRCVIEEIEDWKHLGFPVDGAPAAGAAAGPGAGDGAAGAAAGGGVERARGVGGSGAAGRERTTSGDNQDQDDEDVDDEAEDDDEEEAEDQDDEDDDDDDEDGADAMDEDADEDSQT